MSGRKDFYLAHQSKLPRLPVPTLQETLERYIEYLRPLSTPEELEYTQQQVKQFLAKDAPTLQDYLLELNKKSNTSYIEGFWDTMYVEGRYPSPINVSPGFLFVDDPKRTTQVSRASQLVLATLEFYQKVQTQTLPPHIDKNVPLCMFQLSRFFNTARIPLSGRDKLVTYSESKHIVVLINHQFFHFDLFEDLNNPETYLSEEQLQKNLQQIISLSRSNFSGDNYDLDILTSENRDKWAQLRSQLSGFDPVNAQSLEIIDSAIVMLVLDGASPSSTTEGTAGVLHGWGKNRWYDKVLQLIVFENGMAGLNLEHCGVDGHTTTTYLEELYIHSKKVTDPKKGRLHCSPKKLQWKIPIGFETHIKKAQENFLQLVNITSLQTIEFTNYGKQFIISKKCSPDAVLQLSFQLAYYRFTGGSVASTYESCNVKHFLHGRTECIRSVTMETLQFCKEFADGVETSGCAEKRRRKYELFQKALNSHTKRLGECKKGKGVDRHLYALRWIAGWMVHSLHGYQMPSLFTDPSYSKLCSSVLSTSNCNSNLIRFFAFGPVVDNGFGLGYQISNNMVQIVVSNFHGEAVAFAKILEGVLLELRKLLELGETLVSSSKL